jgi:hypothetical protein
MSSEITKETSKETRREMTGEIRGGINREISMAKEVKERRKMLRVGKQALETKN